MTQDQENKLKSLVQKYNDILLVSMKLAVAEDLINLIILNGDDKEFHLSNLLKEKDQLSTFIMKEFLNQNSSSVMNDLKIMEDPTAGLMKRISKKRK